MIVENENEPFSFQILREIRRAVKSITVQNGFPEDMKAVVLGDSEAGIGAERPAVIIDKVSENWGEGEHADQLSMQVELSVQLVYLTARSTGPDQGELFRLSQAAHSLKRVLGKLNPKHKPDAGLESMPPIKGITEEHIPVGEKEGDPMAVRLEVEYTYYVHLSSPEKIEDF